VYRRRLWLLRNQAALAAAAGVLLVLALALAMAVTHPGGTCRAVPAAGPGKAHYTLECQP
jgi:hypothetical protein